MRSFYNEVCDLCEQLASQENLCRASRGTGFADTCNALRLGSLIIGLQTLGIVVGKPWEEARRSFSQKSMMDLERDLICINNREWHDEGFVAEHPCCLWQLLDATVTRTLHPDAEFERRIMALLKSNMRD